jgi:hypothetical protein
VAARSRLQVGKNFFDIPESAFLNFLGTDRQNLQKSDPLLVLSTISYVNGRGGFEKNALHLISVGDETRCLAA